MLTKREVVKSTIIKFLWIFPCHDKPMVAKLSWSRCSSSAYRQSSKRMACCSVHFIVQGRQIDAGGRASGGAGTLQGDRNTAHRRVCSPSAAGRVANHHWRAAQGARSKSKSTPVGFISHLIVLYCTKRTIHNYCCLQNLFSKIWRNMDKALIYCGQLTV